MIDRSCIFGRPELPPQLRTFPCSSYGASLDTGYRGGYRGLGVAMRDASRESHCDKPSRQLRVCDAHASPQRVIAFVHLNRRLAFVRGLTVASDERERGSRISTRAQAPRG